MNPWILVSILMGICVVLFVCWACVAVGAEDDERQERARRDE